MPGIMIPPHSMLHGDEGPSVKETMGAIQVLTQSDFDGSVTSVVCARGLIVGRVGEFAIFIACLAFFKVFPP